jgi:spore maturation protein CgeB
MTDNMLCSSINLLKTIHFSLNDLSEKIERCLKDKQGRERIADNAYREAMEKYDISVVKRNFAEIVSRIIS